MHYSVRPAVHRASTTQTQAVSVLLSSRTTVRAEGFQSEDVGRCLVFCQEKKENERMNRTLAQMIVFFL